MASAVRVVSSVLAVLMLGVTASHADEAVSVASGFGSVTAPIPVMDPNAARLIMAASLTNGASNIAHTPDILPLMGQPLAMMASTPLADPARVAEILGSTSTASLSTIAPALAASPAPAVAAQVSAPIAADGADAQRVALYTQLMELNGTANNVRMILKNAKESIRMVVIERAGTLTLTPEQELAYDQAARNILRDTETALIHDIAVTQSKAFSEAEIRALLRANDTPAARKYNAAKYVAPSEAVTQIQSYMVDAVYKILKTYKQVIAS